jgi:hypothetical protein
MWHWDSLSVLDERLTWGWDADELGSVAHIDSGINRAHGRECSGLGFEPWYFGLRRWQ